ncbi:MAG: hypothetical protein IJ682_07960 [Lachnospiraceae bacterium]|nr:hypothetical protein [Lachnospiraceae bacterium]
MTVYSEIKKGQKPSRENIEEIRKASEMNIAADDDAPEYSYEELVRMRNLAKEKKGELQITLSIPDATVEKAKAYGNNYRTILSRLLSLAVEDKELVRKAMI